MRDLHGNYNWQRMATGLHMDHQIHQMLDKVHIKGDERVVADPTLKRVADGEAPGSRGFVNDEEVLGEQRRLILIRKFKSDPRLLKMLKE